MYNLGPITSNCGKWKVQRGKIPPAPRAGSRPTFENPNFSSIWNRRPAGSDFLYSWGCDHFWMDGFLFGAWIHVTWNSTWNFPSGVSNLLIGWKFESKTKEHMSGRNLLFREVFNLLGVFYVGCVQKICFMWQRFDPFFLLAGKQTKNWINSFGIL